MQFTSRILHESLSTPFPLLFRPCEKPLETGFEVILILMGGLDLGIDSVESMRYTGVSIKAQPF